MMNGTTVSPSEVKRLIENGAVLIDIREEDEFRHESIAGAVSLPLTSIKTGKGLEDATSSTMIFHCHAGVRTIREIETLARVAKSREVLLLEGGLLAWKQAGLPTVRSLRQPLPVMRQVQITAGSIILAGVVAGYFLHPAFFLLSGFVGAGLLFAGFSGWCGMASLLAKMPWNKP